MSHASDSTAPKNGEEIQRTSGGAFIISLDFELFWGVRDIFTPEQYGANIAGARVAIPRMLELFERHGIRATFATVGLLFFENKAAMLEGLPSRRPKYSNPNLSPYQGYIDRIGPDERGDPWHFAPSLIRQIAKAGQEIGCHTFSHYYCVEPGQTVDDFSADLVAARQAAKAMGLALLSLVFPRNQYNREYLAACAREGIATFRGNEKTWFNSPRATTSETKLRRMGRLLDCYVNLSGHHTFPIERARGEILNLPSSRFLRPWSRPLRVFEPLRLARITQAMTYAARNREAYHLWWHPHNFGTNLGENLGFLGAILRHFETLRREHDFQSASMGDLAEQYVKARHAS